MDPCLQIGETRAVLRLSAKCPTERDQLNSCTKEGAKISIPVFKKKLEIMSALSAMDLFTFEKSFNTFSLLSGETKTNLKGLYLQSVHWEEDSAERNMNMKNSTIVRSQNLLLRPEAGGGGIFIPKNFVHLFKVLHHSRTIYQISLKITLL